jgi:hypothetical protein
MATFFDDTAHKKLMRRINACTHTLYSVADEIDEVDLISSDDIFAMNNIDFMSADQRADLVIAVENLIDIAMFVTDKTRDVAWKHSPVPVPDDQED